MSLTLNALPAFPPARKIGLLPALADEVIVLQGEKRVTCVVDFGAPVALAQHQYLERGGKARAVVESATVVAGNQYSVLARISSHLDNLTAGPPELVVVDPGEAEIFNIALVMKGGPGVPVRADGGSIKEMLVYKESISSVDFAGMDYSSMDAFYTAQRHSAELYGDQSRRLLPTPGSTDHLGVEQREVGKTEWTDAKGTKHTTASPITETSQFGLGGGSVFTMDDITFGLEVCLDHLQKKLGKYVASAAAKGQPMVQVQLIPSCGMSIKQRDCAPDGLVFNVDATEYAAEKLTGGVAAKLTPASTIKIAPPPPKLDKLFDVSPANTASGDGLILVYTPVNTPAKGTYPP